MVTVKAKHKTRKKAIVKDTEVRVLTIKCGMKEEEARLSNGVRQGCSLSPYLFNLYVQEATESVREEINLGIKITSRHVKICG